MYKAGQLNPTFSLFLCPRYSPTISTILKPFLTQCHLLSRFLIVFLNILCEILRTILSFFRLCHLVLPCFFLNKFLLLSHLGTSPGNGVSSLDVSEQGNVCKERVAEEKKPKCTKMSTLFAKKRRLLHHCRCRRRRCRRRRRRRRRCCRC